MKKVKPYYGLRLYVDFVDTTMEIIVNTRNIRFDNTNNIMEMIVHLGKGYGDISNEMQLWYDNAWNSVGTIKKVCGYLDVMNSKREISRFINLYNVYPIILNKKAGFFKMFVESNETVYVN